MRSITMTTEQTAIYDSGSSSEQRQLMTELREQAEAMREDGETIEIYTADGIVAEVVQSAA